MHRSFAQVVGLVSVNKMNQGRKMRWKRDGCDDWRALAVDGARPRTETIVVCSQFVCPRQVVNMMKPMKRQSVTVAEGLRIVSTSAFSEACCLRVCTFRARDLDKMFMSSSPPRYNRVTVYGDNFGLSVAGSLRSMGCQFRSARAQP
jgi:hypothetical protein